MAVKLLRANPNPNPNREPNPYPHSHLDPDTDQVAVKLLRCGATVLATSRFAVDAAARFAALPDAPSWRDRLHVYGIDLRDLAAIGNPNPNPNPNSNPSPSPDPDPGQALLPPLLLLAPLRPASLPCAQLHARLLLLLSSAAHYALLPLLYRPTEVKP